MLSSSPTLASERSAVVFHSVRQSPEADTLALAQAPEQDRRS
jgi:hypothetical protein